MTGACLASGPGPGLEEMVTVGTIAVHEFITLDGVIEAPSWSFDYPYDPAMGEAIGQIMGSSEAILLGRRTYQEFAPAWSARTAEEDPGAPFMNESPKYVVSASLQAGDWANTIILGPLPRVGDLFAGSDRGCSRVLIAVEGRNRDKCS